MKKAGLYIHFPFCRRACFYCHFFKKNYGPDAASRYLDCLVAEMKLRRDPDLVVDTVYFGGGSPSLLSGEQLRTMLLAVQKNFPLAAGREITLEANPEDITEKQLEAFHDLGVNRLSLGVQSFQERDLRFLKRTHGATEAVQAVTMAREAGFANISIDLIIGLETQTCQSMKLNFHTIEKLKPTHISVYILEGVPRPINDDRDARIYFQARENLLALGYQHYEVSNYCYPGKTSRHNLKYWQNQPYLGLGASAAGYFHGRDYKNFPDLKKYYAALEQGKLPQMRTKQMDPEKRRIITGLRLFEGIPASVFKAFSTSTDFLLAEGFLVHNGKNLAVPPEKILLLNEILTYFL